MFVSSNFWKIHKYFIFATIFYRDYPPLYQCSPELVLCDHIKIRLVNKKWIPLFWQVAFYSVTVKILKKICFLVKWGEGGSQIWKWCTNTYWRMKVGGIQCKILLKSIGCGLQKNGIFFDVFFQKWGSFSVQKYYSKPKFANFMFKITAKFEVSHYACEARANLPFVCKIWYKSGKKGVIRCKNGVKKGGLLTDTWYPPTYGSAPPPPPPRKTAIDASLVLTRCVPCCAIAILLFSF